MVTLRNLLQMTDLEDFFVIAGQEGVDNGVKNVSIIDRPEMMERLEMYDLILTSSDIFSYDVNFQQIVKAAIKAGASGLCIKTHHLEISNEVELLASLNKFPIIKVTYKFFWSDLISSYYDLKKNVNKTEAKLSLDTTDEADLHLSNVKDKLYNELLYKVVNKKNFNKEIKELDSFKYNDEPYYAVFLITGENFLEVYNNLQKAVAYYRGNEGKNVVHKYTYMHYDKAGKNAVVLLRFSLIKDIPNPNDWVRGILYKLDRDLIKKGNGCIVLSKVYKTHRKIPTCYQETLDVIKIGMDLWEDSCVHTYFAVSFFIAAYKCGLENHYGFEAFENYGSKVNFDLYKTLEVYFGCGSLQKAAKKLFIHENTLRYRLQKIEELIYVDLDSAAVRFNLMIGIKLYRLFKKEKQWS